MHRFGIALLGTLCACAALSPAAHAVLPKNSVWTQDTISSGDGTKLHVDIFRDKDTPADAKTPVILTVSPYTIPEGTDPSSRFNDFVDGAKILSKGYRYVIVTMRSFGLSEGCSDWGGPGEQMDVVAGVKYAANAPWSTGKVGLFGKSYDGWTGLMGIANRAPGLSAVLAMEPVYDGYRYLYQDGLRMTNSLLTPTSFMTTAQPACAVTYIADQQDDNPDSAFWQARELINKSKGATTPLFLTQGYLEDNTKQDGAFSYWNGMAGPKHAWFGQWQHVRGYEKTGTEYATGKSDFLKEAMTFYDAFLKEDGKARDDFAKLPVVETQDSDGKFRGEDSYPPAGTQMLTTTLKKGAYVDTGVNSGSPYTGTGTAATPATGVGQWSIGQPLTKPVRLAGEPVIDADVITVAPRANFVANVYDIAPDGKANLVSRGAKLIRLPGPQQVKLRMYGTDWVFAKDHRVAVLISSANQEWWISQPTGSPVVITNSFATLPLLSADSGTPLSGQATPRLRTFKGNTISVPQQVIDLNSTPFNVGG